MKIISWMKFRPVYFLLSAAVIVTSIFSLRAWGLPLGIEFKGGTITEYSFEKPISTEGVTKKIEESGIEVSGVQNIGENSYLFRLGEVSYENRDKLRSLLKDFSGGEVNEERFESVGPSIGPELIKKTVYAIAISSLSILLWIALQFKSFKFGISALLAMFHDTFNLVGIYALLGHFYNAEVDFLFVTALLTTLSFSVHDTIVVYDRVREIRRKYGGDVKQVANRAVSETMRRSINNSLTIVFMLLALVGLGGLTVRWFAAALLIGTILGTYSSPFVAVPILVTWEEIVKKLKNRK